MQTLRLALKRGGVSLLIAALTLFYPLSSIRVAAQTAPSDSSTTTTTTTTEQTVTTPAPETTGSQTDSASQQPTTTQPEPPECPVVNGTKSPTGTSGHTYTFNPNTCLWENAYYTWSPATKQYTKKTAYDYNYNTVTGEWTKVEPKVQAPAPTTSSATNPSVPATTNLSSPATTAAGSDSQLDLGVTNNLDVNYDNNVQVLNFINTLSGSGNLTVDGNRAVGNATTGDATSIANIINMLQSDTGFMNGNLPVYSADIQGDIYGDLFIDPNALAALQQTSANLDNSVDINIQNDAVIDNQINVVAQSGDADITYNRSVGDVATGNANAVLNLMNMINSAITGGSSFLGMLNIYGNLNGDILLPPDLLQQVIANNGAGSTVDTSIIENTDILVDLERNQTINNDVNVGANSGGVTVDSNLAVGNISSGDATSNLTILNLTGREIDARNSLLVFVNVLGSWVGLIMNAPAGTTAAALGSDVTRNVTVDSDVNINAEDNSLINNDINVNAQSGNANVANNRAVGNVSTGNATASANVANLLNTNFALSDWFGLLFINVFGSWAGSFGVDTAAGGFQGGQGGGAPTGSTASASQPQVFSFVPTSESRFRVERASFGPGSATGDNSDTVLAATSDPTSPDNPAGQTASTQTSKEVVPVAATGSSSAFGTIAGGLAGVGVALFLLERLLSIRRSAMV